MTDPLFHDMISDMIVVRLKAGRQANIVWHSMLVAAAVVLWLPACRSDQDRAADQTGTTRSALSSSATPQTRRQSAENGVPAEGHEFSHPTFHSKNLGYSFALPSGQWRNTARKKVASPRQFSEETVSFQPGRADVILQVWRNEEKLDLKTWFDGYARAMNPDAELTLRSMKRENGRQIEIIEALTEPSPQAPARMELYMALDGLVFRAICIDGFDPVAMADTRRMLASITSDREAR